jgi:hypothetical protein
MTPERLGGGNNMGGARGPCSPSCTPSTNRHSPESSSRNTEPETACAGSGGHARCAAAAPSADGGFGGRAAAASEGKNNNTAASEHRRRTRAGCIASCFDRPSPSVGCVLQSSESLSPKVCFSRRRLRLGSTRAATARQERWPVPSCRKHKLKESTIGRRGCGAVRRRPPRAPASFRLARRGRVGSLAAGWQPGKSDAARAADVRTERLKRAACCSPQAGRRTYARRRPQGSRARRRPILARRSRPAAPWSSPTAHHHAHAHGAQPTKAPAVPSRHAPAGSSCPLSPLSPLARRQQT